MRENPFLSGDPRRCKSLPKTVNLNEAYFHAINLRPVEYHLLDLQKFPTVLGCRFDETWLYSGFYWSFIYYIFRIQAIIFY